MSKVCKTKSKPAHTSMCLVTGKKSMRGHKVSHSNHKSNRIFRANLKSLRFWLPSQKRFVTLKVSTKGLRTINKYGDIETALASLNIHLPN